ncbi:MAG: 4-hydroxybenzoate octaprenyltransferase [Pseudomonadota bacterium]|nr:4-hydroxybenzoate octaprenyltransferase [Pseudomonadota bacterium]MDE3037757.1 4-hydroxybenzoate octaprenyltransferase [Pseudomonadota bacterium]
MRISSYLRLMRLNQPTGIWLLLWPCWWAIALASRGLPPPSLLLLFGIGAVLMRSAGCIVNDIADRKFDARVARTKYRPLASGEVSVAQASMLLVILLAAAFGITLLLGKAVLSWAVPSLPLVITYPFMKRLTWWPQLFLGLTFNWGALVGWAAVRGMVGWPAVFLYIGGIFWTLGYDTIYAHQDKSDDVVIGVKSLALRLGNNRCAIGLFYFLTVLGWVLAGWTAGSSLLFFALLVLVQLQFVWQTCTVDLDDPTSCRRIFMSNVRLGLLMFVGCLLSSGL